MTFVIRVAIVEDEKAVRESMTRLVQSTPDFQCAGIYTNAEETLQATARTTARSGADERPSCQKCPASNAPTG